MGVKCDAAAVKPADTAFFTVCAALLQWLPRGVFFYYFGVVCLWVAFVVSVDQRAPRWRIIFPIPVYWGVAVAEHVQPPVITLTLALCACLHAPASGHEGCDSLAA